MLYQVTTCPTSPCLCFADSGSSVKSFPQRGINLESINRHLVSHMSTDLPYSNTERLHLMPWTILLIWGQQIQELVKSLKDFKSFLILHQGIPKTPDKKGEHLHEMQAMRVPLLL